MRTKLHYPPIEAVKEKWKGFTFKGIDYSKYYHVSNWGRIRSLDRKTKGKNGSLRTTLGIVIKLFKDKDGYKIFTPSIASEKATIRVHIVAATAFIGIIPKGYVAHHINGIPFHNFLSNISIITSRANKSIEKTLKSGLPVGVTKVKIRKLLHHSRIGYLGTRVFLGCYKCPLIAGEAYQVALNFIENNPNATIKQIKYKVNIFRDTKGLAKSIMAILGG